MPWIARAIRSLTLLGGAVFFWEIRRRVRVIDRKEAPRCIGIEYHFLERD
jgi:hypothetical protein